MTSTAQDQSQSLSISHSRPPSVVPKTVVSDVNFRQVEESKPLMTVSRNVPPSTSDTSPNDRQRSVGIQAKIGGPLKILTPRPWKGSTTPAPPTPTPPTPASLTPAPILGSQNYIGAELSSVCPSSGVSAASSPRPASAHSIDYSTPRTTPSATPLATPADTPLATPVDTPLTTPKRPEKPTTPRWSKEHDYICSSPEMNDNALLLDERVVDGIKTKTKKSNKYDIRLVMQRKVQNNEKLEVKQMLVHDGSTKKSLYTSRGHESSKRKK